MEVRTPSVGEVLVHRFRRRPGQIEAIVTHVDQDNRSVTIEVEGKEYSSLSAAAEAVSGSSQNGWTYWGLKKQKARGRPEKRT